MRVVSSLALMRAIERLLSGGESRWVGNSKETRGWHHQSSRGGSDFWKRALWGVLEVRSARGRSVFTEASLTRWTWSDPDLMSLAAVGIQRHLRKQQKTERTGVQKVSSELITVENEGCLRLIPEMAAVCFLSVIRPVCAHGVIP